MAKRTQTRNRVPKKRTGRRRSPKVSVMPLVIKTSPEDTQGVIRAAVDESTGRPRAVIPIAVKRNKVIRKRAAVIPVAVKTLHQPGAISKRVARRPEAENTLTLRGAAIGIADELIEVEKNFIRLGLHYIEAIGTRLTNTVLGRTMSRFEAEIRSAQRSAPSERAERYTLLRVA